MRILFIEKNRSSTAEVAELARVMGHEFQVAHDRDDAVSCMQQQKFDVVFVEIDSPDTDGQEICSLIRESERSRGACVVAVTEITDLRRREPDLFDGYVHKPITAQALEKATSFRRLGPYT